MTLFDKKVLIYTDGGSRGNPGPAAAGFVVDGKGYGEYLGKTTNNIAEYTAIVRALEVAKETVGAKHLKDTVVEVRMDSQLAQRQLIGRYKVKNAGLRPLVDRVKVLETYFKSVKYVHVRREQNTEADAMVNKALDEA